MNNEADLNQSDTAASEQVDPWRGMSFSGVTLVLGVGTGRQVPLLAEKCLEADGLLVVADSSPARLQTLRDAQPPASVIAWVLGRTRQIPLMDEVVDLLVLNGQLREVPAPRLAVICEEMWRVIVPGGQLRIADVLEAGTSAPQRAWAERNRIVRRLGLALDKPTALAVDIKAAVQALRRTGFEELHVSLLPGYALTEAWLEETIQAIRGMAGRVVDRDLRHYILDQDVQHLVEAFNTGSQRAPERFVLQAIKPGDLSVTMEAPFTEADLNTPPD